MTSALFVAAHPDDELLGMSVAIAEHVAAGQDVHVLWLSAGTASGALQAINGATVSGWWGLLHLPAAEGYQPLDAAALGVARLAEADAAMRVLTAGLPGTLTLHCADLPDGQITPDAAAAAIRQTADTITTGAVRVKTHSHLVDDHPDHLAAGAGARQLAVETPLRFGDLRHYVLPPYWSDPRLSQVAEGFDLPADATVTARVRNAIRQYGLWLPAAGRYAVGYHSVAGMLDQLAATPKCMVHP